MEGINCQSKNIFHYRDFSHRVLAVHRENLHKRKYEEIEGDESSIEIKSQKENRYKKINRGKFKYNEDADNEDNIFMNEKKRMHTINDISKNKIKNNQKNKSLVKGIRKFDNSTVRDKSENTEIHKLHYKIPSKFPLTYNTKIDKTIVNAEFNKISCNIIEEIVDKDEALKSSIMNIDISVINTNLDEENSNIQDKINLEENYINTEKRGESFNIIFIYFVNMSNEILNILFFS